jgi:hypothetical protein
MSEERTQQDSSTCTTRNFQNNFDRNICAYLRFSISSSALYQFKLDGLSTATSALMLILSAHLSINCLHGPFLRTSSSYAL